MNYYTRLSDLGYERLSYWHQPLLEPLISLTVGQLMDWAADQYADRVALVSLFENTRWTFGQVMEKANELAAGLLSLGLNPGDMIALWGYNSSYHYLATLAAAKAGLILAKLDPEYQAPQLQHCLNKVGAKLLIAAETHQSQGYYHIVRSLAPDLDHCAPGKLCSKQLPHLKTLVFTGDLPRQGAYLIDDVIKMATPESIKRLHELQHTIQPDDSAFIHYTSGTTGSPKAAVLTHHLSVNGSRTTRNILNPQNKPLKMLAQMQSCHIVTSIYCVLAGLHIGGTTVFASPKFDPTISIKAVQEERTMACFLCEIIFGTPAMYVDVVSEIQERGVILTYPKIAFIGGSTISEALARQVVKVLPLEKFIPVYGMTEGVSLFAASVQDDMEKCILNVGKAINGIELKVVDKEGRMVPFGTPGELWARGFCVMKGYWNDEEKTKETITKDGWLKTGDQVTLQSDGVCKIVGRIKESIIRGGSNIYPKEVEECFTAHPDVVDVLAFGVPDARWTEEVCVYIRPRQGSKLDEQQMKSFCKGKVADYRIPRYIRFAEKFPQNLIGKIDKMKMRENFLQDKEYLENNETIMKRFYGYTSN